MCGIAGIIQSGPKHGPDTLERMTAALAHRGPDGKGFWQNDSSTALLGHRRLAILDLTAAGDQPMHFQNPHTGARYSIVHNGEIYNYIELRKQLQNEGYRFHTQTDTEVILAAYDYWQEECVDYFDGMFAFAIWDEQEHELFAARDRFGEKPFFFWKQDDTLLFASEIKALWAAGIPRTANLKMLFNFITIGYTGNPADPRETFFEQVQKLPPASRLYFNPADDYFSIEKYYEIDPDEQNLRITDTEAIEKFRSLLDASLKRRLRSDVAVGCSLSGGLDSSAIATRIHDLQPNNPLHCFT
ncbi:MAG: asparagine synthase (glutamine-hydrolyzing), partial [Chitinophagaceae bacterium]|nr:asparagine synthase (glutamine-hydrolyzing) [Chitinophagaceae bacterium]